MEKSEKREQAVDSCRSILAAMREYRMMDEKHPLIREALLEDLCKKVKDIATSERAFFLTEGLYYCAPQRIRELFQEDDFSVSKLAKLPSHEKMIVNVGFITVIPQELRALLLALGRKPNDKDCVSHGPFRYWHGQMLRPSGEALSYVLTIVGEPRNLPCALAVMNLLANYSVDLMVLVGIAAGLESKVNLGNAVTVDHVLDYEHVRSELQKNGKVVEVPRPELPKVDHHIQVDFAELNQERFACRFGNCLGVMPDEWLPPDTKKEEIHPKLVDPATSAAGERLFADDSLEEMRTGQDERIRAADQEDSGFAQACAFRKTKWAIFRGISDYGKPNKEKGWHGVSSLSAACAALEFLTHAYRSPKDVGNEDMHF